MQLKQPLIFAAMLFCTPLSLTVHAEESVWVASFSQNNDSLPDNTIASESKKSTPGNLATKIESTAKATAHQDDDLNTPLQVSGDLWDRIRSGFALSEMNNPLVQENENWYANRPDYVKRMIARSKLYLYYIVEEVEKRGMPTEIALLPMIESAFNPKAYSTSHASGIWQFVPSTGKYFGLEQNIRYDGRRDVTAATRAALDYLEKLHNMFGTWELALAAYNWGEGSVSRAIARNEAKGEPTDYQSLSMPAETRSYVPKLIAAKNIVMNPAQFGLNLASIPNEPYFKKVIAKRHMDVKLAARLAEMPLSDFISLNPAHNGPVLAANGPRTLLLPVEKADTFTTNLSSYSKPLVSWQSYSARKGERLDKIAKKFGTTISALTEYNQIVLHKNKLAMNQSLLVPLRNNDNSDLIAVNLKSAEPESISVTSEKASHKVKSGDTIYSIARRYNVSTAQLKAWNHLKTNQITHGQTLAIQRNVPADNSAIKTAAKSGKLHIAKTKNNDGKRTMYTVRRGDTLHSIANQFNVAINDIQRWNNLAQKHALRPGQKVTVYL